MKKIIFILILLTWGPFYIKGQPLSSDYRDQATDNLFKALKHMTDKGYTMFGQANAYTIGYNAGPKNNNITSSDIKEVTGDNPAFVESDFMWYSDRNFMEWDINAMKEAHKRGAVLGYCWHLAGPESKSFYVGEKGNYSKDFNLVEKILSSDNRNKNKELNWFLTKLDSLVIPVFKELKFPLVFRPFHEMTGGWFWWGNNIGTENYKRLFRLTVDYLREKGIKNILYCWSPDKDADFNYYPGDEYVDILGYDAYEPGLKPYITHEKLIREIGKLVEYADAHHKIVAWTEVGLRSEKAGVYEYPGEHPDFWTKYVWDVVKENPATNRLAWIMTWYNADWNKDGKGTPFTPYAGMDKKGSKEAVADFQKLFHYNYSLFEKDMPDMSGTKGESTMYILPKSPVLKVGQNVNLVGGTLSGWFNDTDQQSWESINPSVASVDAVSGILKAKSIGETIVIVRHNGYSASVKVVVW